MLQVVVSHNNATPRNEANTSAGEMRFVHILEAANRHELYQIDVVQVPTGKRTTRHTPKNCQSQQRVVVSESTKLT